jgi:DNA repair protein SbcC/Rad50
MIIESVRLKNIKSYGEGVDGKGVTVSFQPGTNRIAGKNGHGKTTLIEGLGYALFLTEPVFEENFQLGTYFLRAGKKAAEIDVTFSQLGERYRIERGLGPYNKRQTKVVQLNDGSTCAEGEAEVSAFICRLLGFPDRKRFSELFWKLIGVRQGRLTWPFDSKPSVAKDFFEPLLEVAVFRECFHALKPAVDEFELRLHDQEKIKAGIEERIRERSDSAVTVEAKQLQARTFAERLESLNEARDVARKTIEQLEAKEISQDEALRQLNVARSVCVLARQQRETAEQRVRESLAAGERLALVVSGYQAYERAERELKDLRDRQAEQHRLEKEMADAEKKKAESDGKSAAAGLQAEAFASQKKEKEAEKRDVCIRLDGLRSRLSGSQSEFDSQKSAMDRAMRDLSDVRHFVNNFGSSVAHGEATLEKMKELTRTLSGWDPTVLLKASREEAAAGEALQRLREQLAAASAEHSSISRQLEEIEGGICPFLKERCRQFDPSKVEGDLRQQGATIDYLRKNIEAAESALSAAKAESERLRQEDKTLTGKSSQLQQMAVEYAGAFERLAWDPTDTAVSSLREWVQIIQPIAEFTKPAVACLDAMALEAGHRKNVLYLQELQNWWRVTENIVEARLDAFREEDRRRNADQQDEVNWNDQLRRIEAEISKLSAAENKLREDAATSLSQSARLLESIVSLEQRLQAFGFLANEVAGQEAIQQKHRSDYQQYLGAKPMADQRSARENDLQVRRQEEADADAMVRFREIAYAEVSRDFDPEALPALRREFEQISAAAGKESANLENAKRELEREEKRLREWQEACATRDEIVRETGRLAAAIKLTELARVVLKDSAPAVAQHLCDRIARRAQQTFNQINDDPVELRWEAAPRYSLRVIPGERRFAMLSGGEQTKLALAMTLAMIQEFSGLRFCVFDEPTYGVDAESREKLGEAMLAAQKAAGLEQLIIVSHDEAFDGKIEHSIFLRKTAANGTEVVESLREDR